jgi:hypothetical protein
MMTEEDKNAAAAYIKLQDDVKQLIVDTVLEEMRLHMYGPLVSQIRQHTILSPEFKDQVKNVIRDQMTKY